MGCVICGVRHGETDWNVACRLQGRKNIGLNATGQRQVREVALELALVKFDAILSSPLVRAKETASVIAGLSQMNVAIHDSLIERSFGKFEGLTRDEARLRHPKDFGRYSVRDPSFDFRGTGESLYMLASRVKCAFEGIASAYNGKRILVVTHGAVLDIAYRLATGTALHAVLPRKVGNGSFEWFQVSTHPLALKLLKVDILNTPLDAGHIPGHE